MQNQENINYSKAGLIRFAFTLQVIVIFSYSFIASAYFGFERPNSLLFILILIAILGEISLNQIGNLFQKTKAEFKFPIGALITSLSCSLLIDATNPDPYIFAVILAILSKKLFYFNKSHYFNPANFGVVLVLLFYGGNINLSAAIFAGSSYLALIFFIFGLIISSLAGQIYTSIFWILNFAFFALIRSNFHLDEFFANLSALSSVAMLLFMFNMITDPKTTPKTFLGKFYFTFLIAAIDAIFRYFYIPHGNFYGLFLISSLTPFILNSSLMQKIISALISLAILSVIILKTFILPPKSAKEFEEKYQEIIFINDSQKITPSFTHQDNPSYYKGSKNIAFRSLFFAPGIAIADLNKDNYQDFVIVNSKPNSLPEIYLNENGFKFRKNDNFIDQKSLPKKDQFDSNIAPFLADFDGDGDLDLFVTSVKCAKFFLNKNNKFIYQKDHPFSQICDSNFAALPYYFDQDNKADLLLIRYWNKEWQKTFEEQNEEDFQSKIVNLFRQGNVILNGENGSKSEIYLSSKNKWISLNEGENLNWSFDATTSDLNNDGKLEIIMANDFGNDRIYNLEEEKLIDVTTNFKNFDRRNGMNASTNYLPNDPYPFLYISNIWIENYQEKGNFYFQFDKYQNELKNHAEESGLENCKWAWGAAFADFNLDGFNDSYIANGYITFNDDRKNDRKAAFQNAYFQTLPSSAQIKKFFTSSNQTPIPITGEEILITDGQGQRDCLRIYSPNSNKFIEAKKHKSLDFGSDSRAAAMLDYDNDGDIDLLVTRQNNNLTLLKNITQEKTPRKNWVGFKIANQHQIKQIRVKQGDDFYFKDWNLGRSGFLASSDSRIYLTFKNESEIEVSFIFKDGKKIISRKFIPGKYYNLGKI